MRVFSLLLVTLISTTARAADRECADFQEDYGALQVTVNQWCELSVGTADWASKRYRTYSFDIDGRFSIFVRTDESTQLSRVTGTRAFFLAPRRLDSEPRVVAVGAGILQVQGPAGQSAVFSTDTAQMLSLEGYEVKVASQILITNEGGVSVKALPGSLVIDTAWKRGGTGYDQNRSTVASVITDGADHSCKVKNNLIFLYADGEGDYRLQTDALFADLLKTNCPALDRSRL